MGGGLAQAGILRTIVLNMRMYNSIERPDFTPERITGLKADAEACAAIAMKIT